MKKSFFVLLLFTMSVNAQIISINEWNSFNTNGWNVSDYENIDIVQDSSSYNPPNVLQIRFPAGFRDGGEPAFTYFPNLNVKEIYIGFWLKIEKDYYQHDVVQKLIYLRIKNTNDNIYLGIKKDGSLIFTEQPTWTSHRNLYANLNTSYGKITPGLWQWIEVHSVMNSPGVKDGVVELWVDGVKTHSYNDVALAKSDINNPVFSTVIIRPIFGGNKGIINQREWYMWFDFTILSKTPIGFPESSGGKLFAPRGIRIQR